MIIVGDKEVETGKPSVRRKGRGDLGEIDPGELVRQIKKEDDLREL